MYVSQIVRDYTLSCYQNNGLQQLQRGFVQAVVNAAADASKASANAVHVATYVNSQLTEHIRAAAIVPLTTDSLVQSLLLHENENVGGAVGAVRSTTRDMAAMARMHE